MQDIVVTAGDANGPSTFYAVVEIVCRPACDANCAGPCLLDLCLECTDCDAGI